MNKMIKKINWFLGAIIIMTPFVLSTQFSFAQSTTTIAITFPYGQSHEVGGEIRLTMKIPEQYQNSSVQVLLFPSIAKTQGGITPTVLSQSSDIWKYQVGTETFLSVPSTVAEGDYFIRVVCISSCMPDFSFIDSTIFKIIKPFIRVISPNGGEQIPAGSFYNFKWDYSGDYDYVNILLTPEGGGAQPVIKLGAQYYSGIGGYSGFIDSSTPPGKYRVTIEGAKNSSIYDESDSLITVTTSTQTVQFSLISPNGGESWELGKTYNLKWTVIPNQKIQSLSISIFGEGLGDSYFSLTGVATSSNNGVIDFTLPNDISGPVPGKYKIAMGFNCPGWFASYDVMSRNCALFGVSAMPLTIISTSPQKNIPSTQASPTLPEAPKSVIPPTTPQSSPSLNTQIVGPFSFGMRNNEVRKLQDVLYQEGMFTDYTTGYYGIKTIEAVKKFQIKYNLVSSGSPNTTGFGLAGPATRKKLNEILMGKISASSQNTTSTTESLQTQITVLLNQVKALQDKLKMLQRE